MMLFTLRSNSVFLVLMSVIISFSVTSCKNDASSGKHAKIDTIPKAGKVTAKVIAGNFNQASGISFDSNKVKDFLASRPQFAQFSKDFETFYKANHYSYVWYGKGGLIETTNALISGIDNEAASGVNAKIPYYEEFKQLLQSDSSNKKNLTAPDITTELMLTAQYFNYAKNIWTGSVNDKAESIDWFLPRKKLSYADLLKANLASGNLQSTEEANVTPQYEGLKKELAHYRDIEKAGGEAVIPSLKKRGLKLNDSSDIIPQFQQRLMQLGIIKEKVTTNVYNAALINPVNDLKERYGLKPDSIITNALITEMNVPAKKRVEQILVNMERLRWIPVSTDSEFILVNIPEFTLHYYENNKHAWECNVVVGKPMTKTVIFSGMMKYVIFSPYWYVPSSIINKEVRPGMARSGSYLARHNMEWNGGQVRQKPGVSNSLGLVKFIFPNSNNIYLHDTPSKSLFGEDSRAFSHGCVRVGKPRDLAIRILKQAPEWTPEKIDEDMHGGKEKTVTLKRQIPVYIGYFTAFMKNGQLNFRPDIYQNDSKLLALLMQN